MCLGTYLIVYHCLQNLSGASRTAWSVQSKPNRGFMPFEFITFAQHVNTHSALANVGESPISDSSALATTYCIMAIESSTCESSFLAKTYPILVIIPLSALSSKPWSRWSRRKNRTSPNPIFQATLPQAKCFCTIGSPGRSDDSWHSSSRPQTSSQ